MTDVLRIKRRAVGGAAGPPATLAAAEIAFNEQDRTLYYGLGNSGGIATSIIPIAGSGGFLPLAGGTVSGTLFLTAATTPLDIVVNSPTSSIRFHNATSGVGATAVPTLELIGVRGDANATFQSRVGLGFRRSDGVLLDNGFFGLLGTLGFGGQWGTDNTTYQAAKFLYAASINGIAEGAFTAAATMPTALIFCTGSAGVLLNVVNQTIGTERMRITSSGSIGIGTSTPQALFHIGTTAATARVYNSFTNAGNGEWTYAGDWGPTFPNTATYGSDKNGTGLARDVNFVRGGVEQLRFASTGMTASVGIAFGSTTAPGVLDLSRHISLYGTNYGFSITGARLNYIGASHRFLIGASTIDYLTITAAGLGIGGSISGSVTLAVPAVAGANTITFPAGTTNFSVTGGVGRVVKQLTAGGAFTVAAVTGNELDGTQILPTLLGTAALPGTVGRGVAVMGNYAYVCNNATTPLHQLEIYDISNPTLPVKVGGIDLLQQPLGSPVVAGHILYTGVNIAASGLKIIDVSNPKVPSVLRVFNAGAAVQYLALSGAYLYVGFSGTNTNFRIYDISDPANPIQKGNVTMPGASGTRTIVLQGKYAFVGTGQAVAGVGGLVIYDVSDAANPVLVSSSFNCATAVSGLCVAGKYLYIAGATAANGLEVLNIEDPAAPVSLKIFAVTGVPNTGANPIIAGNYLFNTNNTANGLQVIDISDPVNPVSVGVVSTVASAIGAVLRGSCLYVASTTTFRIYDTAGVDITTLRTGSINTDNIYVDGQSNFNGDIYAMRSLVVGQAGIFSRGPIFTDASEAIIPISAVFGNGLVCVGENAATSPALKRFGTTLQIRLGDDSNYAPVAASTPAAGDSSNLIATTAFVASAIITATAQIPVLVVTTTTALTVSTKGLVLVNNTAPVTITLPLTPATGNVLTIKDGLGNAGTFPITISGSIDNASSMVLNFAFSWVTVVYTGTKWVQI